MRHFIVVALYHSSQGLPEMESVLVTLSRISMYQSLHIEEQQILLDKKSQIDQLLNVEASFVQSI
jgi:hypothetical protein